MSWKPQQQSLEDLVGLLKKTSSNDTVVQREVYQVFFIFFKNF
jgi:hypothetical protein